MDTSRTLTTPDQYAGESQKLYNAKYFVYEVRPSLFLLTQVLFKSITVYHFYLHFIYVINSVSLGMTVETMSAGTISDRQNADYRLTFVSTMRWTTISAVRHFNMPLY